MKKFDILCVIPSLPEDLRLQTIQSILNQTYPVKMIAILPQKVEGKTVAEKVSKVLNEGLSHIKIDDFDYILRVDGDVILPPNFLEENLKEEPDLCGTAGYAMLIKVSTFKRVAAKKFHPKSDDSYIRYKFMKERCKTIKYRVKPILLRKSGRHHGVNYFLNRGKSMYRLGYEPFHVLASVRFTPWNVFAFFGYLTCLIKHEKRFDIAKFVWTKQIEKLFHFSKFKTLK